MSKISTSEFKAGIKVEIDKEPYTIVSTEYVNPGKGQAFCRVKLKQLKNERVIERTFKSGEKLELADVVESKMRLLYSDKESATFMDESNFEQFAIPRSILSDQAIWLQEEAVYQLVFYKGEPIELIPPTFMEMQIAETAPGIRGDSSGRVLKPAITDSGAKIQVPIFINQGDRIKIDTRSSSYISRS